MVAPEVVLVPSVAAPADGECRLYCLPTAALPAAAFAMLDPAERFRAARFMRRADRHRFVAGRALTRRVLGAYLGVAPTDVRVDRPCPDCAEPHGKPRLADPDAPVAFSVAHSGGLAVLAVVRSGPHVEIGVDAEAVEPHRMTPGVVRRMLAPTERAREPDPVPPLRALTYWVRKEAILKATGDGLRCALDEIVTGPADEAPALLSWPARPDLPQRTAMGELRLDGGAYLAAVAVVGAALRSLTVTNVATLIGT